VSVTRAALLPPGKGPPVLIVQEAGWAPEPVWTQRLEKKSFAQILLNVQDFYFHKVGNTGYDEGIFGP
jgi:hypothetical protein